MQIGKVFCGVTALGPGRRIAIWTAGCKRNCKGCSNPELRIVSDHQQTDLEVLLGGLDLAAHTGVTITGGEPFLQPEELHQLVTALRHRGIDDILVYTGYRYAELVEMQSDAVNGVLSQVAAVIDGEFIEDLVDDVPLRGSSNQQLIVLNPVYQAVYEDYLKTEKRLDIFYTDDGEVHFVGIPPQNYDELYQAYLGLKRTEGAKKDDE